jgi:hypothetical protein
MSSKEDWATPIARALVNELGPRSLYEVLRALLIEAARFSTTCSELDTAIMQVLKDGTTPDDIAVLLGVFDRIAHDPEPAVRGQSWFFFTDVLGHGYEAAEKIVWEELVVDRHPQVRIDTLSYLMEHFGDYEEPETYFGENAILPLEGVLGALLDAANEEKHGPTTVGATPSNQ